MAEMTGQRQLNTVGGPAPLSDETRDLLSVVRKHQDADKAIYDVPTYLRLENLSVHRQNIFEWYPFEPQATVMELCAEYGAVTGAFVYRVANVVSVTDDEGKAKVINERYADAPSLEVRLGTYMQILENTDETFDYIVFFGGKLSVEELQLIRAHLKGNGKLLIATENRNGMKYLAGCRDVYTDQYYDGVEHYRFGTERTYDLPKWKKTLFEAGFEEATFRYPYPDHRFCETIYSDDRLPEKHQLCKSLRNFDGRRLLTFDEGCVFDTMIGYGIFPLFSNSFFIETGPSCNMVYTKFSKERRQAYRIYTSLYEKNGERMVQKVAACKEASEHIRLMENNKRLLSELYEDEEFHVADCQRHGDCIEFEYIKGETLASVIDDSVAAGDEEALYRAIDILKRAVERISSKKTFLPNAAFNEVFGSVELPRGLTGTTLSVVDLIADNFIINDKVNMIDYEWILPFSIPLEFVMFRSLFLSKGISTLSEEQKKKLYRYAGVNYAKFNVFLEMEVLFQQLVSSPMYDLQNLYKRMGNPAYDLRAVDFDRLLYQTKLLNADNGQMLAFRTQSNRSASITALLDDSVKIVAVELAQSALFTRRPIIRASLNGKEVVCGYTHNAYMVVGEDLYFNKNPRLTFKNRGYSNISIEYTAHTWDDELVRMLIEQQERCGTATCLENPDCDDLSQLYGEGEYMPVSDDDDMDVTIVIPTKNGGEIFKKVLEAVYSQKTHYRYEVICVDSGSSDDTIETIKRFGATLYEIPPEEFGHGKTRNFGASKGTGEFIVFITQDAQPVTNTWLENFINAMKMDDEIVGGFGIHYAYPDCNVFDKRDLQVHFERFGTDNTIFRLEDPERYEKDEAYRHLLAFFSDNNSCLRRSVWEQYPYDDVNFAEDQIWARKMIEMGHKKLYCPYAPVYHSHDYPLGTYFKRYYDEFKSLYRLHEYMIVPHWYYTVPAAVRHLFNDIKYLRTVPLSRKQKIKWAWYSWWRNLYRYVGGYIGGRYHAYSPKVQRFLDRHISQQYDQINDKK